MEDDDGRFLGVECADIGVGCVCGIVNRGIVIRAVEVDEGHDEEIREKEVVTIVESGIT